MEDDKRVNYKLDAINKLINNLKLSISGNKEHDELGENNVIVNLDEISQKITELHEMVKAEFDEFENQHKSESDETQTLLTEKFDLVHSDLATISDKLTTIDTNIKNMSSALQGKFNALIAAVNDMKAFVSLGMYIADIEKSGELTKILHKGKIALFAYLIKIPISLIGGAVPQPDA